MKSDIEAFLMTALTVLIVIAIYNSLFKKFTPVPVRNLIGL